MGAIKLIEEFEFHQTLEKSRDIAIVFFSSQECSSCRYWEQLLIQFTHINPQASIYKIDSGLNQALTQEFNVFHLPALFLYLDGEFYSEIQCEAKLESIGKAIDDALKGPPQEMP